jgi:hypothetical protein
MTPQKMAEKERLKHQQLNKWISLVLQVVNTDFLVTLNKGRCNGSYQPVSAYMKLCWVITYAISFYGNLYHSLLTCLRKAFESMFNH